MENRRKSEDNEMQLKTGRQAWKISKKRFSQTVRRPISQCENFADPFRNAKIHQPKFAMRKFRNAKFRNAKCHFAMPNSKFAMPILISQCEISQCQMPFRNANFEFTLPIPISQCENLAIPNSQCENFAMRKFRNAKFRNAKAHFALRKSLPLRNSISQTISHCQIHPAKFTGLVILCN